MADEPMPRLPNYRRDYNRRREDLVATAVAAVLRAEGHVIEDGYRPAEGEARSPDWMMVIDGVPTALEVTRLLPRAHVQKAESLVTDIETQARHILMPIVAGCGGQVLLGVSYSASGVATLSRAQLASDAPRLASEVDAVLARPRFGADMFVEMPSSVTWVIRADVMLVPGPQDGFYIIQKPDEAQQPNLDDILARTIDSKGDQHVGYAGRAILALDAMFDDVDDLREAFEHCRVAVPWWRVYSVVGSGATPVFEHSRT